MHARTSSGSLSRLNFMSSAVHEAMSGETARGGTTERAAPGAARRAEQAESSASIRTTCERIANRHAPCWRSLVKYTSGYSHCFPTRQRRHPVQLLATYLIHVDPPAPQTR